MNNIFSLFWHNTIWYLILSLISATLVVIASIQSTNWKRTLVIYFSIIGITYLIEYPILVIFHGYSYYPMLMKEPFDDSMFGNVFSQTALSAAAIFIAIKELSFIWFIIFSIFYSLIELLFIKLGIFELYWYNTWFTLLGLIGYFWITKLWYKKVVNSPHQAIQHIALFLSVFAVYSPSVEWPLRLFGIYLFKINVFSDPARNHVFQYVVYIFFILNLLIVIYKSNCNLTCKLLIPMSIYIANYILFKLNVLYIKSHWVFVYSTIVIAVNFLLVMLFNKMFGFKNKEIW